MKDTIAWVRLSALAGLLWETVSPELESLPQLDSWGEGL